jgi:hypothetical protein
MSKACILPQINERETVSNPNSCQADCAMPFLQCPPFALKDAPTCNGLGVCHNSLGACVCTKGYSGDDCSVCAAGFKRINGFCVAGTAIAPPRTGTGSLLVVLPERRSMFESKSAIVGVAVSCVGLALVGAYFVDRGRHRALLRMHNKDMTRLGATPAA